MLEMYSVVLTLGLMLHNERGQNLLYGVELLLIASPALCKSTCFGRTDTPLQRRVIKHYWGQYQPRA